MRYGGNQRQPEALSWQRRTKLQTPTLPPSVLQVTSYSPACAHSYLVPTLGSYALLVLADTQLKSLKINPRLLTAEVFFVQ